LSTCTETTLALKASRDTAPWSSRICAAWQKSVEGIIEVGRLLIEAKAELAHGSFERMIETELPFSTSKARMLMAIAAHPRLANRERVHALPPSWGTLYELTKLDHESFALAEKEGLIRPDLERKEVIAFRRKLAAAVSSDDGDAAGSIPPSERGVHEPPPDPESNHDDDEDPPLVVAASSASIPLSEIDRVAGQVGPRKRWTVSASTGGTTTVDSRDPVFTVQRIINTFRTSVDILIDVQDAIRDDQRVELACTLRRALRAIESERRAPIETATPNAAHVLDVIETELQESHFVKPSGRQR